MTASGIVAENIRTRRSGFTASKMASISSVKPMSSISSASSRTKYSTFDRSSAPRLIMSRTRPGVPTTTSMPRSSDLSCRLMAWPPYTATVLGCAPWRSDTISACTWMASSRVGTSTMARTYGAASRSSSTRGRPNAAVFPVPVRARATRSPPPARSSGMARAWIGVGSSNPFFLRRASVFSPSPRDSKPASAMVVLPPTASRAARTCGPARAGWSCAGGWTSG